MTNEIAPIEYCRTTISLKEQIEGSFLVLAERLHAIRSGTLWQSEWESWEEFVSELKISTATASKLISVYQHYVVQFGLPQDTLITAGWAGLYEMLPMAKTKQDAEDCVMKASTLRREELREELREHKHGKCAHDDEIEVHFYQCKGCGSRRRV